MAAPVRAVDFPVRGLRGRVLHQHPARQRQLRFHGRPLSFPKWSYGGDLAYSWSLGDFKVTAEGNYSFHDTYSQFYLLGSDDFTIPKYWLANANLSLSPASAVPGRWRCGEGIFSTRATHHPELLPAQQRSGGGRGAGDGGHSSRLQVLKPSENILPGAWHRDPGCGRRVAEAARTGHSLCGPGSQVRQRGVAIRRPAGGLSRPLSR